MTKQTLPKIHIVIENNQPITTSRNVAENFDKQHKHVLEAIDELTEGLAENSANLFYETEYVHPQNKRTFREIYMTKDGFTLLAMGFTGKKALEFKLAYIDQFNEMEHQLKNNLPGTYKEALLQLVEQVDQKEQLEKQIQLDAPKVLFADAVSASHTSILVGDLAKLLRQNGVDIGQNRLFEWLRDHGYLISRKGESWNSPTQYSMDRGWFEVKERTHQEPNGSVRITKTTKVTGKGQQYFINKFLSE